MTLSKFQWEDFNNPKLRKLKKKYALEEIVRKGECEFERQLLLRSWVFETLSLGEPSCDYSRLSAVEILTDASTGKKFYCTQYTQVYLQCAISLGWYVRKLGVDSDHKKEEEEMHHGVCDIWSNDFNKWYVVDPMHDLHFEKNGIPLNSLEIRTEYIRNKARNIVGVTGMGGKHKTYKPDSVGFDFPANYFWFFISLRNNFLKRPGLYNTKALLWVDKYNKNKIWYKGGGKKGQVHKHPMYKSHFIKTNDINLCFPKMEK